MYQIVYGILYIISLLPLRVLFLFSDLAFLIVYHVVGYRRKVVGQNLAAAFPEKTERERRQIARQFYRNFCDSFLETLKLLSASPDFIQAHFTADYSLLRQLHAEGRKCQVHLGHQFNWELANAAAALTIPQKLLTVYMPLSSRLFERLLLKLRGRTGAVLLPATKMRASILPYRNEVYVMALVADQSPADPHNAHWVNFFGRPTPFLKAPESGARIGNLPVVFVHYTRPKRGHYVAHFLLAEDQPSQTATGDITVRYVRYLEDVIRQQPATWLWSHRRWKWDWNEAYGPVLG